MLSSVTLGLVKIYTNPVTLSNIFLGEEHPHVTEAFHYSAFTEATHVPTPFTIISKEVLLPRSVLQSKHQ